MSAHESKPEVTNPVLWTVALLIFTIGIACWFGYWLGKGKTHGLSNPHPAKADGVVKGVPDHAAYIKDLSPEVLARGKEKYMANCVACHGPKGVPVIPSARNFTTEAFKNDVHGAKAHPWSMFDTLTNGYNGGAMPPQGHISEEDRYAIVHFVRETFVKEANPSQYVSIEEALSAEFPAPAVASGEAGPTGPHPRSLPVTIPVYAVLEQTSEKTADTYAASAKFLNTVQDSVIDVSLRSALVSVKRFAGTQLGASIVEQVKLGSEDTLIALLLKPEVAALEPVFGTLSKTEFHHLYTALATGRSK